MLPTSLTKLSLNLRPPFPALPFLDILFQETLVVNLGNYKVRIPSPEAFFIHKLIIAQRRSTIVKKENDLSQGKAIIPILHQDQLSKLIRTFRASAKTKKAILDSCRAISFPPHILQF